MYLRMGFSMIVGLYTSRVVLQALGVNDFGLYNVIGGVVGLFIILNSAMVNTTSRFITFRLAKNDLLESRRIFSMSMLIHGIIACIILVLGETIGLWYLHEKLVIPEGRFFAAEWLYQLSVVTSLFSVLLVPFNASIVAHERMSAFAVIQIVDVFLRLFVVLLLSYSPIDKLIFYATLLALIQVFDLFVYITYCRRNFPDTKLLFYWSKPVFLEMMNFAGWALVGNFCNFFYTQGVNLMLNAFCGPAANAARGIAVQVENVIKQFANNVQTAINPQIIKTYASNEKERMYSLISASSRYCFYLLYLLTLPILLETNFILEIWLGQVPDHTISFIRLILVIALFDAFVNPMFTANLASGKLRIYHLSLSILMYGFMFVTYYSIKLTGIAESVFYSYLIATIIGYIMKIFILEFQVGFLVKDYLKGVFVPAFLVSITSIIFPLFVHSYLNEGWLCFLITGIISVFSVLLCVWLFGVSPAERSFLRTFIRNKLNREN